MIYIRNIYSAPKGVRKFGGKGGAREKAEANSRIRRSKLVSSVRSNIIRRRLVNINRDARVRRAKLMRRYFKFDLVFFLSIVSSIQTGAVFMFTNSSNQITRQIVLNEFINS